MSQSCRKIELWSTTNMFLYPMILVYNFFFYFVYLHLRQENGTCPIYQQQQKLSITSQYIPRIRKRNGKYMSKQGQGNQCRTPGFKFWANTVVFLANTVFFWQIQWYFGQIQWYFG